MKINKIKIGIIGLGYVGLPLAIEFSKIFFTIGFDIDGSRINQLKAGNDKTLEIKQKDLNKAKNLNYTSNISDLKNCNFYIITVPTPIDNKNNPDLSNLILATEEVGNIIKKNDFIVYESTVYPGATEEICAPILEKKSGLKFINSMNKNFIKEGFFLGYSPERINPGDKSHSLTQIIKITSGSTPEATKYINKIYGKIITAGTYMVENIQIAEAAKVIENTQRDVNIALINELSILFHALNIDTESVLKAAETKWNFVKFRPGLVGGHCIGVDPYYLTYKAKSINHNPEIILAGRKINDSMADYISKRTITGLKNKKIKIKGSRILIMGLTFKENCPDIRNSKIFQIYKTLNQKGAKIEIYDPWVKDDESVSMFGIKTIRNLTVRKYDSVIIAVPHLKFYKMGSKKIKDLCKKKSLIFDVKYLFPKGTFDIRL